MKILSIKIFFLTILVGIPFVVSAQIYKIVFTTEEQHIDANEISEAITIQTQDSSGNSFQTPETIDLEFISSSKTGEFLSSTGNSVSKTMNKNTSNRTFYYKDPSEGSFLISVKATGRESLKTWEASQKIFVGELSDHSISYTPIENSSDHSSVSVSTSAVSTSNQLLDVSIGEDRNISLGSPATFQATIKKNTVSNAGLDFNWSFGDGNVGVGKTVSHTYKYPGEYVVVLRSKAGEVFSVSRIKVKVLKPEIILYVDKNFVEIENKTNQEINLFNWKIVSGSMGFIFQADTILLPKSKIILDKSLFKLKREKEGEVFIQDYNGNIVFSARDKFYEGTQEYINFKFDEIKKEANNILNTAISNKLVVEKSGPQDSVYSEKNNEEILEEGNGEILGEQNVIYESIPKSGVLEKIWLFLSGVLR